MKRSSHLEPLSHDHHTSLAFASGLLRALRENPDADVLAKEVKEHWERELTLHFRQEEDLLLPLLRAGEPDMARQMVDDHRRIETLVDALQGAGDDRLSLLRTFAETIRAHIRFEERDAFPAVERQADPEVLAQIGSRLK